MKESLSKIDVDVKFYEDKAKRITQLREIMMTKAEEFKQLKIEYKDIIQMIEDNEFIIKSVHSGVFIEDDFDPQIEILTKLLTAYEDLVDGHRKKQEALNNQIKEFLTKEKVQWAEAGDRSRSITPKPHMLDFEFSTFYFEFVFFLLQLLLSS